MLQYTTDDFVVLHLFIQYHHVISMHRAITVPRMSASLLFFRCIFAINDPMAGNRSVYDGIYLAHHAYFLTSRRYHQLAPVLILEILLVLG